MARYYSDKYLAAASAFTLGLVIAVSAAMSGHVRLGAGDVELVFERGDKAALAIHVGERVCPPECGFIDLSWERTQANPTLLLVSRYVR